MKAILLIEHALSAARKCAVDGSGTVVPIVGTEQKGAGLVVFLDCSNLWAFTGCKSATKPPEVRSQSVIDLFGSLDTALSNETPYGYAVIAQPVVVVGDDHFPGDGRPAIARVRLSEARAHRWLALGPPRCIDCNSTVPEGRRSAACSVVRCVQCQAMTER